MASLPTRKRKFPFRQMLFGAWPPHQRGPANLDIRPEQSGRPRDGGARPPGGPAAFRRMAAAGPPGSCARRAQSSKLKSFGGPCSNQSRSWSGDCSRNSGVPSSGSSPGGRSSEGSMASKSSERSAGGSGSGSGSATGSRSGSAIRSADRGAAEAGSSLQRLLRENLVRPDLLVQDVGGRGRARARRLGARRAARRHGGRLGHVGRRSRGGRDARGATPEGLVLLALQLLFRGTQLPLQLEVLPNCFVHCSHGTQKICRWASDSSRRGLAQAWASGRTVPIIGAAGL